jgi:plastocyanin
VVADSDIDTLTLVGSGITITTNAGTDTITFTSSAASTFEGLTEVALGSFRIDQVYMPAITMLTVSNSGAVAYLFDQYSGSNPTIYAIGGTTIAFKLQVTGHPFLIQDGTGTNYNTGLYHVALNGAVSTGVNAQRQTQGTLYWKVPASISGGYRYLCSLHPIMVGAITVKNIVSL